MVLAIAASAAIVNTTWSTTSTHLPTPPLCVTLLDAHVIRKSLAAADSGQMNQSHITNMHFGPLVTGG
jgi:hypothetical protein